MKRKHLYAGLASVLALLTLACAGEVPAPAAPDGAAPAPGGNGKVCCELYDAEQGQKGYSWMASPEACAQTDGTPVEDKGLCDDAKGPGKGKGRKAR